MSFTWLNKQGVKSIHGFIVQCTGRFTSEYQEGPRKITINTDAGKLPNGKYCDIIASDAFSKWDDGIPISKEKQNEIFQNYKDAMEFQGIGVIVDQST
ncbi:MAG: hypothetical protein P4M12_11070 [Gammaproteobacteria bacterium]|nr:hypothetical protein [Gammaproteobacteria bacterium]